MQSAVIGEGNGKGWFNRRTGRLAVPLP